MRGIEDLQALSREVGWDRPIAVAESAQVCGVHQVELSEATLESFAGVYVVQVCPQFDNTCRFDPDATPVLRAPEH